MLAPVLLLSMVASLGFLWMLREKDDDEEYQSRWLVGTLFAILTLSLFAFLRQAGSW